MTSPDTGCSKQFLYWQIIVKIPNLVVFDVPYNYNCFIRVTLTYEDASSIANFAIA
jgi:hypothetical protein